MKRNTLFWRSVMLGVALGMAVDVQAAAPTGLMCNLITGPNVQVLDPAPRFTWISPFSEQTAYQIVVEDDASRAVWDSGKVDSSKSVAVAYGGKALSPDQTYAWRVRTWQGDASSEWSVKQRVTFTPPANDIYTTTRRPLRVTPTPPTKIVRKSDAHWFIDFGRAAFGTIELTLDQPAAGKLTIHLGEKTSDDTTVDRKPGGTLRYRAVTLDTQPGRHVYRVTIPPDRRNTHGAAVLMPKDLFEVLPFRYVEIEGLSKLEPDDIRQLAVTYPFDDDACAFESSDPTLNAVWDLCRYTMKATSFLGVYVDGDRERIPYEADAYINQLGHYGVDREYAMARYSHEYLMRRPTWPTEWILHSVLMAEADWMYTGDLASARAHYDDLKAKTLSALARADGLISTQTGKMTPQVLASVHFKGKLRDIVDWPTTERDGYDLRPINTVVNAFHYRALRHMAKLAEALGRTNEAAEFNRQAEKVYTAFNEKLFDPQTGLYIDGEGSKHSSQHANMFALAFDLAPKDRRRKVAEFVASKNMACSVYGAQYLLEALYEADLDDAALNLMRSKDIRSWYNMIHVGSTVALEAWDMKFKPNLDWNHAWGAAPANIIPRYLVGVRPLEPGFAKALIAPQPGPLKSFSAKVPTIRGPITVDYQQHGVGYELRVNLPGNCPGRIVLPSTAKPLPVKLDGKSIDAPAGQIDHVTPGEHVVTVGG
ncbi:family 78 glycoside hydrolase catalytic domain [Planctomycetales bacterium ZRK34]|nr:family 78 glycoside hydrolase catalytic domain [Planctomycetales bacterium ZRK34]